MRASGHCSDVLASPVWRAPVSTVKTAGGPLTEHADVPVLEATSPSSWKCSRTFPARADQVSQARAFLGRVLADCPMTGDAVLICSELATNAVLHSESARPGGQFTVRAEAREGDYVWLEVEDRGGRWVENGSSDLRGRGLEIVAELADYWDVRGDDTARVVCARLDWPMVMRDGA
jgi:serine/threonine-protein kinase RsbW